MPLNQITKASLKPSEFLLLSDCDIAEKYAMTFITSSYLQYLFLNYNDTQFLFENCFSPLVHKILKIRNFLTLQIHSWFNSHCWLGLEHIVCIPCNGLRPSPHKKGYPDYDTKLHLMVLELLEVLSTAFITIYFQVHCDLVVVPVWIPSVIQTRIIHIQ